MRIAITSDIHFHPPWYPRIQRLADMLREQNLDMLVLAGDIGEPLDMFEQGLMSFQSVCERRAAVAGNHDVWHRAMSFNSQQLWEGILQETAHNCGYIWLEHENVVVGSAAVCGTIAWYDYSGKNPEVKLDDAEYEKIKPMISNDGRYVDWKWSDREFARMVSDAFTLRLDALQNDPAIDDIVVITHVPLYRELLRKYANTEQSVANAYYGNLPLGEVIQARSKVKAAFSGHVHHEQCVEVLRADGQPSLIACNIPSDYGQPAALVCDTETGELITLQVAVPS